MWSVICRARFHNATARSFCRTNPPQTYLRRSRQRRRPAHLTRRRTSWRLGWRCNPSSKSSSHRSSWHAPVSLPVSISRCGGGCGSPMRRWTPSQVVDDCHDWEHFRGFIEACPVASKSASGYRILFTTRKPDLFRDVCRCVGHGSPDAAQPMDLRRWGGLGASHLSPTDPRVSQGRQSPRGGLVVADCRARPSEQHDEPQAAHEARKRRGRGARAGPRPVDRGRPRHDLGDAAAVLLSLPANPGPRSRERGAHVGADKGLRQHPSQHQ